MSKHTQIISFALFFFAMLGCGGNSHNANPLDEVVTEDLPQEDVAVSQDCWACQGLGYVAFECGVCEGTGRLVHREAQKQTRTCASCRGTGFAPCTACENKGYHTCPQCGGHGTYKCYICGGAGALHDSSALGALDRIKPCSKCNQTGHLTCTRCAGSGRLTCPRCNGLRRLECPSCQGTGGSDEVVSESFDSGKCPNCDGVGRGRERCDICSGTGRIKTE